MATLEELSKLEAGTFLEERAQRASKEKFLKVLEDAPDAEPDEKDKLQKAFLVP